MQFTNIKTKTKVIALALQELINKNKVAELKFHKGTVTLRKRNTHPDDSSVF
jgi:hypothetical protein